MWPSPVSNRRDQRAGLRHECQPPFWRIRAQETGIQPQPRTHQTDTVRPHEADVSFPRGGHDLRFQILAAPVAFAKARRQDDGGFHAGLGAVAHDPRHRTRGGGDHGQIDLVRQVCHLAIAGRVTDRFVFGIDRIKGAREPARHQIAPRHCANRVAAWTGPKHGDRGGIKQRGQRAFVHQTNPLRMREDTPHSFAHG